VATELVTSPDVIILDEPTSGLDSAAAASMVRRNRAESTSSKQNVTSSENI
jgi:ABC-type multidrug transport system ATPase subunit